MRTWLRTFITRTVSQQAETFEALTHGGTPFGGNWLPGLHTLSSQSPVTTRNSVLSMQQQLNELTQQVARLNDQVKAIRSSSPSPTTSRSGTASRETSGAKEIGINRFRALQAK